MGVRFLGGGSDHFSHQAGDLGSARISPGWGLSSTTDAFGHEIPLKMRIAGMVSVGRRARWLLRLGFEEGNGVCSLEFD